MKTELTPKQERIYKFIHSFIHKNKTAPSFRDIGAHFGIAPGTVHDQVKALERKGVLKREESQARGIQLGTAAFQIPILGRVFAGTLHTSFDNIEGYVPGITETGGAPVFALTVKGDSMDGAGIFEGDIIVVRQQSTANPGDIVVAMVHDESTVKYFRRKGRQVFLEAANPHYKPISDPDLTIVGKVIEVRRRYE